MKTLAVTDVGDGLSMSIWSINSETIQIDCGSQQYQDYDKKIKLQEIRPDFFILSHFHADHYNGLFCFGTNQILNIKEVFFPQLPKFNDNLKFLMYVFAMNHRIFGRNSGLIEADFLIKLRSLNRTSFKKQSLSLGDEIILGGERIEVIWPPKELNETYFLESVNGAIKKFEEALKDDSKLRKIYQQVQESNIIQEYLGEFNNKEEFNQKLLEEEFRDNNSEKEIPQTTKDANISLRKVANRISLAFNIDNRILFLGDLERREIGKVVDLLNSRNRGYFNILVTPHHGTHWTNKLLNLRFDITVSSLGKKLINKAELEFKKIPYESLWTYLNGDIYIPFYPKWNPRVFRPFI